MIVVEQPIGLIGGEAMQRTVLACRLRRVGLTVFTELQNRKRQKMFAKAKEEANTVYDLDRTEDQETLCWILQAIEGGKDGGHG